VYVNFIELVLDYLFIYVVRGCPVGEWVKDRDNIKQQFNKGNKD